MSRFFATGSSSEDESEDERTTKKAAPPKTANRFAFASDSESESDEDVKPNVRSASDKAVEALDSAIKSTTRQKQGDDWAAISTSWNDLTQKASAIKGGLPANFLKLVLDLDTAAQALLKDDDAMEELTPADGKGLNAMKQNLKKFMTAHQAAFDAYKKGAKGGSSGASAKSAPPKGGNRFAFGDDDEEEEEEEGEEEENEEEEEDGEYHGGDDNDDEDDLENMDDDDIDLNAIAHKITRDFWVKKTPAPTTAAPAATRTRTQRVGKKQEEDHEGTSSIASPSEDKRDEEVAPAVLQKRLREIALSRGKKQSDVNATLNELRFLESKAQDIATKLRIQSLYINTLFDSQVNKAHAMPLSTWKDGIHTLEGMIKTLESTDNVRLAEDDAVFVEDSQGFGEVDPEAAVAAGEDEETVELQVAGIGFLDQFTAARREEAKKEDAKGKDDKECTYVEGSLFSFVFRLSTQFFKALQQADPKSMEYVHRLKEQPRLTSLFSIARAYYRRIEKTSTEAKIALMWLEYEYYRYNPAHDVMNPASAYFNSKAFGALAAAATAAASDSSSSSSSGAAAAAPASAPSTSTSTKSSSTSSSSDSSSSSTVPAMLGARTLTSVDEMASFAYRCEDALSRARALLMQAYYWSVHNRYYEARELLLMSHVQHYINDADIQTRILFNRTMAQVGLAAFRAGEFRHTLHALGDFFNVSNSQLRRMSPKELFAQGVTYRPDSKEEDLLEARRRMLPYHMHFNIDLVESAHLIAGMFVEVPLVAEYGWHQIKSMQSRHFRWQFWRFLSQTQIVHSDWSREHILAAAKALMEGDWVGCVACLDKLKVWSFVHNTAMVKARIRHEVQLVGLRCYLLTFGQHFTSISLPTLVSTFKLPEAEVVRVASSMMNADSPVSPLPAVWDTESQCIVVQGNPQSRIQKASVQFFDKVVQVFEALERSSGLRDGGRGGDRGAAVYDDQGQLVTGGQHRGGSRGGRPERRGAGGAGGAGASGAASTSGSGSSSSGDRSSGSQQGGASQGRGWGNQEGGYKSKRGGATRA